MLYLIIILVCSAIIILCNSLQALTPAILLSNTVGVVVGVVAIIALDGIEALFIRRILPEAMFAPDRKAFKVTKKEHNFYNRLEIKRWKEKVPELGIFTGFDKGHVQSISKEDYLYRFLLEANFGVAIHLANALLGFLILFIPFCSAPSIWMPIFAVNLILSLMPVFILRYNTYILYRLYKRSQNNVKS